MRILMTIEKDEATPMLRNVQRALSNPKALNRAAAEGVLPLVQGNFRAMAATNQNKFGVRSTFWNQMLSGTYAGADNESGYVAMPAPVALRYFGGTVVAKQSSLLAIPANAQAYGKSPRDFSDLRLQIMGRNKDGELAMALVQNQQQGIRYRKRKDGSTHVIQGAEKGGDVFFWLVPSATIQANKDVLPADDKMGQAAEQGVVDYINLLVRRSQ